MKWGSAAFRVVNHNTFSLTPFSILNMHATSFTLNTGASIPAIGLGTFKSLPNQEEADNPIKVALDAGYRHLDLAAIYGNEPEIGRALKSWFAQNPTVKRSDVFITSKLWNTSHRPDLVPKAYEQTLKDLQLEYLDLYLMHWPIASDPDYNNTQSQKPKVETDRVKIIDTWKAMEALYIAKKVKAIGVSNFNAPTLKYLIEKGTVPPAVNQVELHPYLPQVKLVEIAAQLNVHITAYCPLGSSNTSKYALLKDPVIVNIADKLKLTPAQVCVGYVIQRGASVIPKSATPERIRANFIPAALSTDDLLQISTLAHVNHRFVDPSSLFGVDVFADQIIE